MAHWCRRIRGGAANWPPPSFSPKTGLFYINASDAWSIYYIYDDEDKPEGWAGNDRGVTEALALVENQAKVQNIEIRTNFPPAPCQVLGVPGLLEQVFINLLLNAMNAMPDGGTVDILAEQAAGEVVLRVTDTGEGISREDLDKVFDPFFTRAPWERAPALGYRSATPSSISTAARSGSRARAEREAPSR